MTIDELKAQRRWVCWRREVVKGKETKVPYRPDGRRAMSNNAATWGTYAECAAVSQLVGVVLGDGIVGVDFDKCCDAFEGKFTPSSREMVMALDSYAEYSPNGYGAHVLLVADMPGDGKPIVRPGPDFKQIEIKGSGFYFTFSGRHLSKTPRDLMPRQEQLTTLCARVSAQSRPGVVIISGNEEEGFRKLMAGDFSDYGGDMSRADMALVSALGRRYHNDIYKITEVWMGSPLYREKLERTDYRSMTILKALKGEPVFDSDEDAIEDDGIDEYVIEALSKDHEGWFPLGDVSLVGGSSGTGKTYWVMTLLEKARKGQDIWGHKSIARDYRVLMHDRGVKGMRRTLNRLGLPADAKERVIRLTRKQQGLQPAEVLEAAIEANPGVKAWFVEGLDMWFPDVLKMNVVAPLLDDLQRVATRSNVAVIATVGAPKEKTAEGRDTERYHGRDALFGSAALARKAETVVLITKSDMDDETSPRQYSVLPRNGRAERFWLSFVDGQLCEVDRPEPKAREHKGPPSKTGLVRLNIVAKFKPGERIAYSPDLGASKKTYYDWLPEAVAEGVVEKRANGGYYLLPLVG
jgi:phage tail protein X